MGFREDFKKYQGKYSEAKAKAKPSEKDEATLPASAQRSVFRVEMTDPDEPMGTPVVFHVRATNPKQAEIKFIEYILKEFPGTDPHIEYIGKEDMKIIRADVESVQPDVVKLTESGLYGNPVLGVNALFNHLAKKVGAKVTGHSFSIVADKKEYTAVEKAINTFIIDLGLFKYAPRTLPGEGSVKVELEGDGPTIYIYTYTGETTTKVVVTLNK